MKIVAGLVNGPFTGETPFKSAAIKQFSFLHPDRQWFCIETEETIPGFPDAICVPAIQLCAPTRFFEFKCSNDDGVIKFKKSQPLFYRQHCHMHNIYVLAWDKRYNRVVLMTAEEVVARKALSFKLPDEITTVVPARLV